MYSGDIFRGAVVGIFAGAGYFGGLWWTVRRLPSCGHPGRLLFGSFLCRALMAGGVLFMVAGARPLIYAGAALGFIAARMAMIRLYGPDATGPAVERGVRQ
ncbi:MAG: ATP synthase subunit I [Desulfobulbaceae bacterium]|nr:ATP synthase subunit I [Desulfobulbaceae bacterium]